MLAAIWCISGFAGLIVGAEILIRSGTRLAALIGIPPILIGLTVVSIGTSMPELAVGIDAALLGSGALAVGNIAGTNTYNILFILGATAVVPAAGIEVGPALVHIDIPIMALVTLVCVPIFLRGHGVTRLEGGLFVAGYLAYLTYLVVARA